MYLYRSGHRTQYLPQCNLPDLITQKFQDLTVCIVVNGKPYSDRNLGLTRYFYTISIQYIFKFKFHVPRSFILLVTVQDLPRVSSVK